MAGSRTDKSTIAEGKDPLANVTYQQPIDGLIPKLQNESDPKAQDEGEKKPEPKAKKTATPEPDSKLGKGKVTVLVSTELLERLRNAAYWKRKTLAVLAEEGIRLVVKKLEQEHGGPFEPREEELQSGRPQGSRNTNKSR